MNIGLIGYGAWGSHHAVAITETDGLQLSAICSQSDAARTTAAERHLAPTFADYRELLSQPELDAVDIVLPTHLHHEVALAALAAGKHVLLEKPMASNPAECAELIAAANAAGKVLYVGHELRHSTQWGRMRALVEGGAVGTALYATIDLWRRPYRFGSGNWRYDPKRVGSWILEEPIHFFDLGAWWLREAGAPVSVYARASRRSGTPEGLWDNMSSIVAFESGAHLAVNQTLAAAEHHLSAKVVGELGAVLAFWDGEMDRTTEPHCSLKLVRDGELQELAIEASGEFFELRTQCEHFAAVCAGDDEPLITPAEAALAVAACWAAERSIQSGLPEKI